MAGWRLNKNAKEEEGVHPGIIGSKMDFGLISNWIFKFEKIVAPTKAL